MSGKKKSPSPVTSSHCVCVCAYREKLQQLCEALDINPPNYIAMEEGSDHEKLWKDKLIVNDLTFYGDKYHRKKSDVESEVAGMANRLLGGNQEHLLYQNRLQQLSVANGLKFPVYTNTRTGPDHIPTHRAMVEVDGKMFVGHPAKTRRLAELNIGAAYRALLPDMNFNHGL